MNAVDPTAIPTRALLTEQDLAEEFAASFRARRLPEKFFYWFPLSVRAWLELCSDGDYRNYLRSRSTIAREAGTIAGLLADGPVEVVSLGSGQGDKDLLLLEALRDRGAGVTYLPVDTSQALLEMACAAALGEGIAAEGLKADIGNAGHLEALAPASEAPARLVLLLGNTLGSLDPIAAAADLRRLLRPEDRLLLDAELYGGAETLGGYDNPLNRAFAWAPLHSVGIGDDDGELVFEMAEDRRRPGLYLIPKHFRADRPAAARLGGEELPLEPGDRLEMNHSYKYAQGTFLGLLRGAGLDPVWEALSEDGRFLTVLTAPR
jgi:uncharacterized SAM-dependent methyltransferase